MTSGGRKRKHTKIVSKKQQRFFGGVASGLINAPGLSKKEALKHLKESKGKKLPLRTNK
jgi:hypothetical protein